MAPRRLIKWRDSNETVNAGFSREKAVRILARELHRRRLDARFFPRRFVEHCRAHALAFSPAQIHAKENGRPILRLRPPRTGLDSHDRVEVIGLPGEQRLGFQVRDVAIRGVELPIQLFQQVVLLFDVGLFLGEMDVRLDVAGDGCELLVCSNLFFGPLPFAENALCSFLIVPKIGVRDARFESLQALPILGRVKDSSARA